VAGTSRAKDSLRRETCEPWCGCAYEHPQLVGPGWLRNVGLQTWRALAAPFAVTVSLRMAEPAHLATFLSVGQNEPAPGKYPERHRDSAALQRRHRSGCCGGGQRPSAGVLGHYCEHVQRARSVKARQPIAYYPARETDVAVRGRTHAFPVSEDCHPPGRTHHNGDAGSTAPTGSITPLNVSATASSRPPIARLRMWPVANAPSNRLTRTPPCGCQ
jgi:hypothetical protein